MASPYPWLAALQAQVPSLDIRAFRDDLQTCSSVSGYDFRATKLITAAQVSRTCANPSCASVEDVLLGRTATTDTNDAPLMLTVLNNFARPMIRYCWQYRLPDAPCPPQVVTQPNVQLGQDFAAMVNECETAINGSLYMALTLGTGELLHPEACTVPACTGFVKRMRSLRFMLCPGGFDVISSGFEMYCNITWKNYEILPGPVPFVPSEPLPAPPPKDGSPSDSIAPTSDTNSDSPSSNTPVVVTVCAVVVALFAALMFLRWQRQRKNQPKKGNTATPFSTSPTDFVAMGSSSLFDTSNSSQRDYLPANCPYIAVHQLTQVGLIAAGASGLVYLVQDRDGNQYASKQIAKRQLSDAKIDAFIAEISIAVSLKHPQIVQFIGASGISQHHLQAIFEYMEGGDLRRYLDTTRWQPWTHTKLMIARDVAQALAYIHSFNDSEGKVTNGIVHRDLKSRNIMLTKELRAKVGDFGVSRTVSTQATMTAGVGTSRWLAPEVIVGNDGAYDAACDVYSFGVVLTELDSHRLPYYDSVTSTGEELPEIVILSRVADGSLRPSLLSNCLDDVAALAMKCLSFDPKQRPAASELVEELTKILNVSVL